MAKIEQKKAFYGMITYVSLGGDMEDSLVSFYDDRKRFEEEVAYQKKKNTKNYGTILTREQFIEEIAKALDTQGHSFPFGRSLIGNYAEDVIDWKENNQISESIQPELAELNLKVASVYSWEIASGVKPEDATTSVDIHTGQIIINSDSKFEKRYAQIEQADDIPAEKKISEYRGFAYMKNSKKPQIVYGNSKEEILNLLRKWNQTRTPGYTYDTCNIGQYNPEIGKHENYKKIDVVSGKDISNIYLEMPKHISKQEFQDIVKYFKENGAVFNTYKKQWCITKEIKEKGMFEKYLQGNVQENQNMYPQDSVDRQEQPEPQNQEATTMPEKVSVIDHIVNVDKQYVVDLKNGETLRISETELQKNVDINSGREVVAALEEKVREHMKLFSQEDYDISVSNENTQAFKLKEGVKATFYIPAYKASVSGIKEVCGIKEITGHIQEITPDKYVVQEELGKSTEVLRANIYNERQAAIMQKAISKKISAEQMDLVGQPKLSAAQMEQVFNGIQDKLSVYQVALYANSSIETWQMDIYRYGMGNGIPFDDVKEIIQNNSMKPTKWEDSRNMVDKMVKAQRNLIIKDLKNNGLNPEKQLVRKFERLNGMTGKMYSVEEIKKELKKESSNISADRKELVKNIGKEIGYQEKRTLRPVATASKVAIR